MLVIEGADPFEMRAVEGQSPGESLLTREPADMGFIQVGKAAHVGEGRAPRWRAKIGEEARTLEPVNLGEVVPATVRPGDPVTPPASRKFAYFNQAEAPASDRFKIPDRVWLVQPRLVDKGYRRHLCPGYAPAPLGPSSAIRAAWIVSISMRASTLMVAGFETR